MGVNSVLGLSPEPVASDAVSGGRPAGVAEDSCCHFGDQRCQKWSISGEQ